MAHTPEQTDTLVSDWVDVVPGVEATSEYLVGEELTNAVVDDSADTNCARPLIIPHRAETMDNTVTYDI